MQLQSKSFHFISNIFLGISQTIVSDVPERSEFILNIVRLRSHASMIVKKEF